MSLKTGTAVAVVCGLALFALFRAEIGGRHEAPARVEEAELARAAPRAEPVAPVEPAREPARGAETPPGAPAEAARAPDASRPRAPGVWVVGKLLGLPVDVADPKETHLRVSVADGWSTTGAGGADGTYAVEVTRLVRPTTQTLLVSATHPSGRCAAAVELLVTAAARAARAGERVELVLDLELEVVTAVVGRVAADLDLADVPVALLPSDSTEVLRQANCDAHGCFVLFPDRAGAFELIARVEGSLPLQRHVEVALGRVTDVGVLRFEDRGVAIEGTLALPFALPEALTHARWRGHQLPESFGSVEPVVLYRVRARRVLETGAQSSRELFGGVRVVHDQRAVVRTTSAIASVGADGAFRIQGLDPGEYTLVLERAAADVFVAPHVLQQITAPARGVVVGAELGLVTLTVHGAGEGEEEEKVTLEFSGGGHVPETRTEQRFAFVSDRRAPLVLTARAAGSRSAKLDLPVGRGPNEEFELTLAPSSDLGALEISWSSAGFAAPPRVQLWSRGFPIGVAVAASETGCRFVDLAPGASMFTLVPDVPLDSPGGFLSAPSFSVAIEAGGTAHVSVDWRLGGRARFLPDLGARAIDSARARVLDALGAEQGVHYTQRVVVEGGQVMRNSGGYLPLATPTELEPTLPAGEYVLVLSEGETELARVPFAIVGGAIVDVPVVLR